MTKREGLGDMDGGLAQESRMNAIEEGPWRCARLVLDIGGTDEVRVDFLTLDQLVAENEGHEDFVNDIMGTVDSGLVYDDSDHSDPAGIMVFYIPYRKLKVTVEGVVPLCEHGEPLRCSHGNTPETLYWSGGTDCGDPGCVEHAYLRDGDE